MSEPSSTPISVIHHNPPEATTQTKKKTKQQVPTLISPELHALLTATGGGNLATRHLLMTSTSGKPGEEIGNVLGSRSAIRQILSHQCLTNYNTNTTDDAELNLIFNEMLSLIPTNVEDLSDHVPLQYWLAIIDTILTRARMLSLTQVQVHNTINLQLRESCQKIASAITDIHQDLVHWISGMPLTDLTPAQYPEQPCYVHMFIGMIETLRANTLLAFFRVSNSPPFTVLQKHLMARIAIKTAHLVYFIKLSYMPTATI